MSDCACLYGGFEGEEEHPLEVRRVRTARKQHVCRECRRPIMPGEKYEHYTGKNDTVFTVKTCLVCAEIRSALYCDGFYFGSLWEDIRTQLFPQFSVNCVDKLRTVEAKTFLQQRYMAFLGVS